MMVPGLVSVTFRRKSPEEICALCRKAGLRMVEWGGDVHVPAGDLNKARRVRDLTRDEGLAVCSYGSYFRVGEGLERFRIQLETALELGADLIRVWCGSKGSAETDDAARAEIVEELQACGGLAGRHGVTVAPEFHGGTLTDDPISVKRLLRETEGAEHLKFYWQPRWDWDEATRLETLETVLPRLAHLHVFTWRHTPDVLRLPLEEGAGMWKKVFDRAQNACALLEFVENDSDEALLRDAAALRGLVCTPEEEK